MQMLFMHVVQSVDDRILFYFNSFELKMGESRFAVCGFDFRSKDFSATKPKRQPTND